MSTYSSLSDSDRRSFSSRSTDRSRMGTDLAAPV
ncbi:hypothetical protein HID58_013314 [Brassica napus]|uniref:Uncharacterized protein n=1 Tax=Brassica napus TaxID=3708 RepID=A0ABQ8E3L0_BRANA|nr:hypothetical protein HID58_013314 [Brassica napus]